MTNGHVRWVLAFDASCGQCRAMSGVVARDTAERLEVLPLTHDDVEQWRRQALGDNPPWAPTLLRIDGDRVRAWTGTALGIRLVGRLGPAATTRLLRSLGDLRRTTRHQEPGSMSRAGFLRAGAGLGVAIGMILAGRAPAIAKPAPDAVDTWLQANAGNLPREFDDIVKYPMTYRRAIYGTLPEDARGKLWRTHLQRYRDSHPGLTAEQDKLIDRAIAYVTDKFAAGRPSGTPEEKRLESDVTKAFGRAEAAALIATLGPADVPGRESVVGPDGVAIQPGCACSCSTESNWCWSECRWHACSCREFDGCGTFWCCRCNGYCSDCESCQS